MVTLEVSPLGGGAAPADRTLDVTIRPVSWQGGAAMPSISTSITLEQGQTVARKTIAVPQFQSWGSIEIAASEDGRRCDDLSANLGLYWAGISEWSEAAPTMLFLDSDVLPGGRQARQYVFPMTGTPKAKRPERFPDIRSIGSVFVTETGGNGISVADFDPAQDLDDAGLLRIVDRLGRIEFLHPDALPSQWIHLTCVDIIFVSLPDLQLLNGDPVPCLLSE